MKKKKIFVTPLLKQLWCCFSSKEVPQSASVFLYTAIGSLDKEIQNVENILTKIQITPDQYKKYDLEILENEVGGINFKLKSIQKECWKYDCPDSFKNQIRDLVGRCKICLESILFSQNSTMVGLKMIFFEIKESISFESKRKRRSKRTSKKCKKYKIVFN